MRDISSELQDRHRRELSGGKVLMAIAHDLVATERRVSSLWEDMVLGFLGKSTKTYASIQLLGSHGFGEDAAVLLRSLMETVVTATFMAEQPEDRANLFADFDHMIRKRFLDEIEELAVLPVGQLEEVKPEVTAAYERVEGRYPDKLNWSGKSLRAMARDTGLAWHYTVVFRLSSDFVHASPSGIDHFLIDEPGDRRRVMMDPGDEWIEQALIAGAELYARVLLLVNSAFELGQAERIETALASIRPPEPSANGEPAE